MKKTVALLTLILLVVVPIVSWPLLSHRRRKRRLLA